ncbi:MAG TPA: GGDEF domain-containing protein [Gemmatimonadales bacterium]|nr:GGDEF domain-containing protein [Gemmatimonadales bacterium]
MDSPAIAQPLASLPSAFAAACRHARSDSELLENCREALVQRFGSDRIWFSIVSPGNLVVDQLPPESHSGAVEVIRLSSGQTEIVIQADPAVASGLRPHATPIALGLSVMLELHAVLRERQGQLDDAIFQLRALRQVARLLSSVHSAQETESLVLDFMAEVFFCAWACLYRPLGEVYIPKAVRSHRGSMSLNPIDRMELEYAMPADSPVATADDVELAKLFPPTTRVIVSLEAGPERLAVLALGPRLQDQAFGPAECDLAGTLAFAAGIALKNAQLVEQLQSAASTDPLTGLSNRRAMEERLAAELSRTQRHSIRTSVVMLDVDRFKEVNDSMGHAAGDRLLLELARILKQQCRSLDAVGRMGGDEFLVILPMTTCEETGSFVARVQRAVAFLEKTHPEFGRPSLSMGIAEAPRHGDTPDAILGAADAALYRAKRGGRDTVATAEDPC